MGKVDFAYRLTGLACGRTYYFENHVSNAVDEDDGATLSFTTPSCGGALPGVTVTAIDDSASEAGLSTGRFRITRTGDTSNSLGLAHSLGGTATNGVDYDDLSGPLVLAAGSSSIDVTVQPRQDSAEEPSETVVLTINPQSSYLVGQPSTVTVTIADDDVASGGGCGRILVQQPRDQFGGCDEAETGRQWMAENFRLTDRRDVSCLEVSGYYWPNNDPPQSSVFDVVFYEVAGNGTPGAVVHEDHGLHVLREKTGNVLAGMEEWRFTVELTTPVELAAGNYFVEVTGAAGTGGSFCWSGGQLDPVAGLGGLAFKNTGQWSLGDWNLAFKVFERSTSTPTDFYTVTPCRVADTRDPIGPFGGPALTSGSLRAFTVAGRCGVPAGADAVAMNVTVVNPSGAGFLTIFPGDQIIPGTSTINFLAGQTRANNSVTKLSSSGALGVWPAIGGNGQVDFIIDVVGYFADDGLAGLWQGSIAGHPNSSLDIRNESGVFKAWVVVAGEQPPEEMTNLMVSPSTFQGNRPRDNNAEIRLVLDASTSPSCLNGEYLELGTSRPVALCRVQ